MNGLPSLILDIIWEIQCLVVVKMQRSNCKATFRRLTLWHRASQLSWKVCWCSFSGLAWWVYVMHLGHYGWKSQSVSVTEQLGFFKHRTQIQWRAKPREWRLLSWRRLRINIAIEDQHCHCSGRSCLKERKTYVCLDSSLPRLWSIPERWNTPLR